MNLEDFRATTVAPCIRMVLGPGIEDVFEVDQAYWEAHKDDFIEWCLGLDQAEGLGWRDLKQYTGGNGQLAKLLIALGDLAEVWKMHPPRGSPPNMWARHMPVVLVGQPKVPTVVKPSAGALEPDKLCFCCERPMGPPDSLVHDLPASEREPKLCLECEVMGCELEKGPCNVFPEKQAAEKPQLRVAEKEKYEAGPPDGLAEYLKQFQ